MVQASVPENHDVMTQNPHLLFWTSERLQNLEVSMRYDMPSLQAFHRWEDEITKILGIVEIIVDGKKLDDLKASASVAIPDGAKVQAGPQKKQ